MGLAISAVIGMAFYSFLVPLIGQPYTFACIGLLNLLNLVALANFKEPRKISKIDLL